MHFPHFSELFASDTGVISYPCHVSVRINYAAGAVEQTILHLRSAVYVYYSAVTGKHKQGLIKDEKTL